MHIRGHVLFRRYIGIRVREDLRPMKFSILCIELVKVHESIHWYWRSDYNWRINYTRVDKCSYRKSHATPHSSMPPSVQPRAADWTGNYLGRQHFEYVNCARDMRGGRGHCLGLVIAAPRLRRTRLSLPEPWTERKYNIIPAPRLRHTGLSLPEPWTEQKYNIIPAPRLRRTSNGWIA
jgi:hypothetical protein